MLIYASHPCIKSPAPRSFPGLMELYEANYMQVMRLCSGLPNIPHKAVSGVDGALDLHLHVLERSKYTTTILLTYYFQDRIGELKPDPNLKVRIYHDARQAEVLSRSYRRLGIEVNTHDLKHKSEVISKWVLNRFLYKWLGYCRYQGHSFPGEAVYLEQSRSLMQDTETLTDLN